MVGDLTIVIDNNEGFGDFNTKCSLAIVYMVGDNLLFITHY